ncbi:predicted protein [Sclerotinia sclerotiorum 1980 UF-70]|uniref:Uncharacterized protein n=1 Tax=Sclerotinia sclerotiorum (strain ATCC 18683 / 1980 / Ss-1) TaxID=665079 RepID=A7EU61_SCLS1|nr:predicted protein [Sclerotinia sclerotiorum 1980 UF-70]EDN93003.1 predicted protein [Sclerotinia sclerotiorum 1980 UF-70]
MNEPFYFFIVIARVSEPLIRKNDYRPFTAFVCRRHKVKARENLKPRFQVTSGYQYIQLLHRWITHISLGNTFSALPIRRLPGYT